MILFCPQCAVTVKRKVQNLYRCTVRLHVNILATLLCMWLQYGVDSGDTIRLTLLAVDAGSSAGRTKVHCMNTVVPFMKDLLWAISFSGNTPCKPGTIGLSNLCNCPSGESSSLLYFPHSAALATLSTTMGQSWLRRTTVCSILNYYIAYSLIVTWTERCTTTFEDTDSSATVNSLAF